MNHSPVIVVPCSARTSVLHPAHASPPTTSSFEHYGYLMFVYSWHIATFRLLLAHEQWPRPSHFPICLVLMHPPGEEVEDRPSPIHSCNGRQLTIATETTESSTTEGLISPLPPSLSSSIQALALSRISEAISCAQFARVCANPLFISMTSSRGTLLLPFVEFMNENVICRSFRAQYVLARKARRLVPFFCDRKIYKYDNVLTCMACCETMRKRKSQ
uniref:Ski_Sno domain-containing protein n=1 Tax=Steinernema glaseri TaxID=37863 RepID=A0A1I7YY67_9BILA